MKIFQLDIRFTKLLIRISSDIERNCLEVDSLS